MFKVRRMAIKAKRRLQREKDGPGWNFWNNRNLWNNRGGELIVTDKAVRDMRTAKCYAEKARVIDFCKRDGRDISVTCQLLFKEDENCRRTTHCLCYYTIM